MNGAVRCVVIRTCSVATVWMQQTEAAKLDAAIAANHTELGYGG
jgi:hypothetical protein